MLRTGVGMGGSSMFVYSKGIVGKDETYCMCCGQGSVWEGPACLYIVKG